MGQEFRFTTAADGAALLAAADEALTAQGLIVWERADAYLFVDLPGADRSVTKPWGGNVRVELEPGGLYLVINSGQSKPVVAALERIFTERGFDYELEEL